MLLRLNLSKVCGQCYDGASAMLGAKSGVVARVYAAEHLELFSLNCCGHALNLVCADIIRHCKLM